MALLDRFRSRPEWQHPDAAVRAEAVRHVPAHEQALLAGIARDDVDARVRRAAVKKLGDPALLGDVAKSDADEGVRQEAADVLEGIALQAKDAATAGTAVLGLVEARHLVAVAKAAAFEPARRAALARLTDARSLAAVAREAEDAATRLEAVARIEDPSALAGLALKCEHKGVALAAVEKISEAEALRQIAARAKVGAAARRAAALLDARSPASAPPAPEPQEPSRVEPHAEEQHAEEERRKAEDERSYARDTREALCRQIEVASAESALDTGEGIRAVWESLPPLPGPEGEALEERFEKACAEARLRHQAWTTTQAQRAGLEEMCAEAERLAGAANLQEARRGWSALEMRFRELTPSGEEALRARFEQAGAHLRAREAETKQERARRENENLSRLVSLCERLEALAAVEPLSLRDGERALREAKEAHDSAGPLPSKKDRDAITARLEAARKALYPRVQGLRQDAEWKRWANVAVQEALCVEAEALLEAEDLEEAARKLRDLDARWKQASEAPKDKAEVLWQRFKAARDRVRARCDAFFAQRDRELAENLRRKAALCERAEALAESSDWLSTAAAIQALQAEWKQIGPVPHKHAKALWERFRKPCDRFFTRRAQDRKQRAEAWAKNLAQKEALCAQAEALAESTDWEAAAAEIRRLQSDWRAIGPVKKSRSEAVWQRFHTACDHFFDRYRRRHDLAQEASLAAREALCRELEVLVPVADATGPAPPPDDLLSRVQAVLTGWRQAGPLPRGQEDALNERFTSARDRLVATYPKGFEGTDLDPEISRRKLEKLCARVEALVSELEPAAATASGEDIAERLRMALAANTIGGRAAVEARWQSATEEVEAARAATKRLGPIPGEAGRALWERFDKACRRFSEIRPRAAGHRAGSPSHRTSPP